MVCPSSLHELACGCYDLQLCCHVLDRQTVQSLVGGGGPLLPIALLIGQLKSQGHSHSWSGGTSKFKPVLSIHSRDEQYVHFVSVCMCICITHAVTFGLCNRSGRTVHSCSVSLHASLRAMQIGESIWLCTTASICAEA